MCDFAICNNEHRELVYQSYDPLCPACEIREDLLKELEKAKEEIKKLYAIKIEELKKQPE